MMYRALDDSVCDGAGRQPAPPASATYRSCFVSAQLQDKEAARHAFEVLEHLGIGITHDWTTTDDLDEAERHSPEASRRAAADITGVVEADLYVLLSDNVVAGKGMYVELGAALALREVRGTPDVVVVGAMNHDSIFYRHPHVQHFPSLEVFREAVVSRGQAATDEHLTTRAELMSAQRPLDTTSTASR
jgi:hypothetical protein